MRSAAILGVLLVATSTWPVATVDARSRDDKAGRGPRVVIGSKSFTESVVLGEMLVHLVELAGCEPQHRAELGGTQIVWQALLAGEIDAYVEYTGTLTQEIFKKQRIDRFDQMREALEAHGVRMTEPLGFDNNYAIGMAEDRAEELGICTIGDLAGHPELRMGLSDEFMERQDGWPGLARRYELPHTRIRGMEHNIAYRGLDKGALDVMDLYSTDAEIAYYHIRVLDDDRGYFPVYRAVVLYRADLEERAPQAVAALHRLEGAIDNRAMIEMNGRAKIDRVPETVVAAAFLHDNVDESIVVPELSWTYEFKRAVWRFLTNTRQHLLLVVVSLAAAIAVAVPLGIVAYKVPRIGQVILNTVGVIQTLPSLALLVFMIPLLGLGAIPAIVALFLYSLLPIVRNTYTGLKEIPGHIHESALSLGLPAGARLWLIELPMASRSILAGIKTAGVINVGTATIGALIGAGGYGQPILTGIRLDNVPLILQGAIPAAVLAILVQGLFGAVENRLVPQGLRTG